MQLGDLVGERAPCNGGHALDYFVDAPRFCHKKFPLGQPRVLQPLCQRTTHHPITQHKKTKEIPSQRVKPTHARCKTIMALKKKPTNDTYYLIYTSRGSVGFCLVCAVGWCEWSMRESSLLFV